MGIEEPHSPEAQFPTWRTITLGKEKTGIAYIKALSASRMPIHKDVREVLNSSEFSTSSIETDVDLVVLTPVQLGLNQGTDFDVIRKRIEVVGLKLCPAEVGPALRLAYRDQPLGELLYIATDPFLDKKQQLTFPYLFTVGHDRRGMRMGSHVGHPSRLFIGDDDRLVLISPPKRDVSGNTTVRFQ